MESDWRYNVWAMSPDIINVGVKTRLLARIRSGPAAGLWIANGTGPSAIPAYLPDPFTGQLALIGTIGSLTPTPHFPYGLDVDPD